MPWGYGGDCEDEDCFCHFGETFTFMSNNEHLIRLHWSGRRHTANRFKRLAHFAQRNLVDFFPNNLGDSIAVLHDGRPLPLTCAICGQPMDQPSGLSVLPSVLHDGGPYAPPDPRPWVGYMHRACQDAETKKAEDAIPFNAEEFRDEEDNTATPITMTIFTP